MTTLELTRPGLSFLHGKYNINGEDCEINTKTSYVAAGDYFFQGSEADSVINDIWAIWDQSQTLTAQQAFERWINLNL